MSKRKEGEPISFWIKGELYTYTPHEIGLAAAAVYNGHGTPEYEAIYNLYPIGGRSPRWFNEHFRYAWFLAMQDGLLSLNENLQINPEDVAPPRKRF